MDASEIVGARYTYGYIKAITLRNFMCHKHLSLTLTDKLNFIVGRNGSGKSAVLCAIILGLGGKASFANRSNRAVEYVRYGQRMAEIIIALSNDGPCAYMPNEYGNEIIVHRRLYRASGSRYELKSANGRVVSTSVADLNAMLCYFNIHVRNPACILTQDHSRNFLHVLNGRSLYQFYMLCTQLDSIKLDLINARQSALEAGKTMDGKRRGMDASKALILETEEKLKRLMLVQEAEVLLEEVEKEWCWASVKHYEVEVARATTASERKQKEVIELSAKLDTEKASVEELNNEVRSCNAEMDQLKEAVEHYESNQRKTTMDAETIRSNISRERAVVASLKTEIERLKEQLNTYVEKLDAARGQSNNSAKANEDAAEQENEIATLQLDVKAAMHSVQVAEGDVMLLMSTVVALERSIVEKRTELRNIDEHLRTNAEKMSSIRSSVGDRLDRFGVKEKNLAMFVQREHKKFFTKKPRGPIGSLVTVLNSQWTKAVECCLGPLVNAYVCDNFKDADVLRSLAIKNGIASGNLLIIVSEFGDEVAYDLRGHQAECPYPTVLSVLQCENAVVRNVLIDERAIERTLLFTDESLMVRVMMSSQFGNFPFAFSVDGDQCIRHPCFRKYKPSYRRTYVLTTSNEAAMEQLTADCKELSSNKATLVEEIATVSGKLTEMRKELATRQAEVRELNTTKSSKLARINALRSARMESSNFEKDVSMLERQVKDLQRKVASIKEERKQRKSQIEALELKVGDLLSSGDRVEQDRLNALKKIQDITNRMTAIHQSKQLCEANLCSFLKSINEAKVESEELQNIAHASRLQLKEAMSKAQEVCPVRIEVERPLEDIQKHLEQLRLAIDQPVENDCTIEELREKLEMLNGKLDSMTAEYNEARILLENLSSELEKREQFFVSMRNRVDTSVEDSFKSYITLRYSSGGLVIDHDKETVDICLNWERREDADQLRNLRALSGGERSFATVCLLLSLWEIIDLPFRCLDEFDVFMDMINRDTAIETLVEYANEEKNLHRQFIFFSPLQISDSMLDDAVNVIHLSAENRADDES
uniref:SMC_N domain-containing protein n=2 Tax=Trichuris muris TaxID=70415 RepID=A0A5S6QJL6_TRIMR